MWYRCSHTHFLSFSRSSLIWLFLEDNIARRLLYWAVSPNFLSSSCSDGSLQQWDGYYGYLFSMIQLWCYSQQFMLNTSPWQLNSTDPVLTVVVSSFSFSSSSAPPTWLAPPPLLLKLFSSWSWSSLICCFSFDISVFCDWLVTVAAFCLAAETSLSLMATIAACSVSLSLPCSLSFSFFNSASCCKSDYNV